MRGTGESEAHLRRHASGASHRVQPEFAATATRTRAAIESQDAATEEALCGILGLQRAAELMERALTMPVPMASKDEPETPMQRVLRLMETREGRAELATLTWETL